MKIIKGNIDSVSLSSLFIQDDKKLNAIPLSKILVVVDESKSINFYNREKGLFALGKNDSKFHHRSFSFFIIPLSFEALSFVVYAKLNESVGITMVPLVFINSWLLAAKVNISPKHKRIGKLEYPQFNSEEFYLAGYQQSAKKKNRKNVLYAMCSFILPVGILLATQ